MIALYTKIVGGTRTREQITKVLRLFLMKMFLSFWQKHRSRRGRRVLHQTTHNHWTNRSGNDGTGIASHVIGIFRDRLPTIAVDVKGEAHGGKFHSLPIGVESFEIVQFGRSTRKKNFSA